MSVMEQNIHDQDNNSTVTIDELAKNQNLIKCYQMQVDDDRCFPVYLGKYPDIPMAVNKTLNYNKYDLFIVTYILTEDEIKDKLYKIVGVNVFKHNKKDSIYSLDLVKNDESNGYQLLFSDHMKNTSKVIENLEKFPGKDKVLEYIIEKTFEEPLKSILIK